MQTAVQTALQNKKGNKYVEIEHGITYGDRGEIGDNGDIDCLEVCSVL